MECPFCGTHRAAIVSLLFHDLEKGEFLCLPEGRRETVTHPSEDASLNRTLSGRWALLMAGAVGVAIVLACMITLQSWPAPEAARLDSLIAELASETSADAAAWLNEAGEVADRL